MVTDYDASGHDPVSTTLTHGDFGNDAPAIGRGGDIAIDIRLEGNPEVATINFSGASPALADLIAMMPPLERATPGARKDCVLTYIQMGVKDAMRAHGIAPFRFAIEDRTNSAEDSRLTISCFDPATPNITPFDIALWMRVNDDLRLFS